MKKLITILFLLLAVTAFGQVTTTPLTRQFLTNYTEWRALNRLGPETNITQLLKSNQLSGTGTLLGPVTSWTEVETIRPDSSNITANSHIDFGTFSIMYYDSTNLLKAGWYKLTTLRFLGDYTGGDTCNFLCGGSDITTVSLANTQWVESVFFAPTNNSFIQAQINIASGTHAGFTNLSIQPVIFSRSNVVGHAGSEYTIGNFDNLFSTNLIIGESSIPIQPLNIIAGTNVDLDVVTNSGTVNITINATNAPPVTNYNLLAYGDSTNYNANFGYSEQRLNIITNVFFVNSSNKLANTVRNMSIILDNYSGSNRALYFNTNWKWLGTTYNPPTTITNGKTAVLALKSYGSEETNVIAAFAVGP